MIVHYKDPNRFVFRGHVTIPPCSCGTATILRADAPFRKQFAPGRSTPLPSQLQFRSTRLAVLRCVWLAPGFLASPNALGVRLPREPSDRCPFHHHESANGTHADRI